MKIQIDRELKIVLLQALKDGFIDTDKIPQWGGTQLVFSPVPLTEKDIEEIKALQEGKDTD